MINVGSMIGSGIFLVPAAVALQLQSWWLIALAWVLGGVVSLFGALSVAELSAIDPEAGGQFVYLRKVYGPLWGFLFGWTTFAVVMTASIAAVAVGFATYLGYFFPMNDTTIKVVAIGSILVLTCINCLGVRMGATVQNGLTFLKIALLVLFVLLALGHGSAGNLLPLTGEASGAGTLGRFGIALIAILWCYDGWIEITYVAGEVKDPRRTLPRSLVIATLTVILIYLAVNFSFLWVLSIDTVSHSNLVASDAAKVLLGPAGAAFAAIGVIIATLGCNNGFVLTAARVYYAMAKEKQFFSALGTIHPRFRTPVNSLLAQGAWAGILVLTGKFEQLFTYVIFAEWIFYGITAAAVIVSRRRFPAIDRPYKTWGYPVTPVLFILFSFFFVINTLIEDPRDSAIGLGIVLLGLPAYFYWRKGASPEPGAAA
jgi:basic amino acid/polyamine antiporter, APA family